MAETLAQRLKKLSKIETSGLFGETTQTHREPAPSKCLSLNIALGGSLNGGLQAGLLTVAGPSKHFKTLISLITIKAWMDKYPDAMLVFYDSESGLKDAYLKSVGIDPKRVFHAPIRHIEQLKFDIVTMLEALTPSDNVVILVDSIGALPSKKEATDALDGNSAADMVRAKELASLYRCTQMYLIDKGVPAVFINHTYNAMTQHGGQVVSGGTKGIYLSNDIWIIGRQKIQKSGEEIEGYDFIINIEKSRSVKEKRKIPIRVTYDEGLDPFSVLLDLTQEMGIVKRGGSWYTKTTYDPKTGEVSEKKFQAKATLEPHFWDDVLAMPELEEYIKAKYQYGSGLMMREQEQTESTDEPVE